VAGYWADSDPDKALAWIDNLPKGTRQMRALQSSIYSAVSHDVRLTADQSTTSLEGTAREQVLNVVRERWEKIVPEEAEIGEIIG